MEFGGVFRKTLLKQVDHAFMSPAINSGDFTLREIHGIGTWESAFGGSEGEGVVANMGKNKDLLI